MPMPSWAEGDVQGLIEEANASFEQDCQDRHEMGAEKYGEGTYLEKDTIKMMMDELIDVANYIRYTYIKLYMMRKAIGEGEVGIPKPGREMLGKDAIFQPFKPQRD